MEEEDTKEEEEVDHDRVLVDDISYAATDHDDDASTDDDCWLLI